MALKDNWKGFWSSDDSANRQADSSGNGSDLLLSGALTNPTITAIGGKPFAYRNYNNISSGNVVSGSTVSMSFTSGGGIDLPFSWCCFIYLNSITGAIQHIFSKNNTGTPLFEWDVFVGTTGILGFRCFNGASSTNYIGIQTSTALTAGQWYFFAGDYNGSKTNAGFRIFRNGILDTTAPLSSGTYVGMTSNAVLFKIGCNASVATFTNFFNGRMDMLGVRSGLFAIDEVVALYNSGFGIDPFFVPTLSQNWAAYWSSDNVSSEWAGDAPGQQFSVLSDGITTPALVSSGGKPGRYHTMDGTNGNYNLRFNGMLVSGNFTDGLGNDQPFTTTAWFFTNNNTVGQMFIAKRDSTLTPTIPTNGWSLAYSAALGGIVFQMFGNLEGNIFIRAFAPLIPVHGTWYHIVGTYDASKLATGIKIYINGVEQVTTPLMQGVYAGMQPTNLINPYIGMFKGAPTVNTLNGGIDGVGIRRGVTSQAEVTQLYNGGVGLTRDELFGTINQYWTAWYNFDNLTATDTSGNGVNLNVLAGAPLVGAAGKIGQAATISPTDYLGRAASFSGFSFPANTSQLCISFWINPSGVSSGTQEGLFGKGVGAADREWYIGHGINIRGRFFTGDANNYQGAVTTTAPLVDGVWQHIVVQKDNNILTGGTSIYHNGVLQSGNTLESLGTYTGMIANNGDFNVGTLGAPAVSRSNGLYDLIGIRSQSLTQDQIMQLYNAGNGLKLFPKGGGAMMNFF